MVATLVLNPDNPCNTTITDGETQEVLYIVATEHTNRRTVTRVKNAVGTTIIASEWRDVQSDLVTLGEGGTPVPQNVWLRKSWIPFKDTVYLEHKGKKYKWKGNGPGLTFEFYSDDDKTHPMAKFINPRCMIDKTVHPPEEIQSPAKLLLDPRGVEMRDIVVVSFLLLEKSRRARENSTMNHSAAVAIPGA